MAKKYKILWDVREVDVPTDDEIDAHEGIEHQRTRDKEVP